MTYRIYIHDGRAHMDELLACALYIVGREEAPEEVARISVNEAQKRLRESVLDEKVDSVFIDCGEHYDVSRKLFDHHQDVSLPSAAKLIFDEFFGELKDSELGAWVDWVSKIDTRGPQVINSLGIDKDIFTCINSGQKILLLAFEHAPFETLNVFVQGLKDKIGFERQIKEASVWLEANSKLVELGKFKLLEILAKPPANLVRAVHFAEGAVVDETGVIAVYGFSMDTENARTFFRTHEGDHHLDFTKATPAETIFCHNNGFLLKFKPANPTEWLGLIKQSLI
jgi:Uncharacterised protein family (UPF0160)